MVVFPNQMHGIIVICNCNIHFVSVIVIEEPFSKVIVKDPKVIDNSLLLFYYIYCYKLTKYQVCLHGGLHVDELVRLSVSQWLPCPLAIWAFGLDGKSC